MRWHTMLNWETRWHEMVRSKRGLEELRLPNPAFRRNHVPEVLPRFNCWHLLNINRQQYLTVQLIIYCSFSKESCISLQPFKMFTFLQSCAVVPQLCTSSICTLAARNVVSSFDGKTLFHMQRWYFFSASKSDKVLNPLAASFNHSWLQTLKHIIKPARCWSSQ